MRIETTFSPEFDDWYAAFAATENGKQLLDIEGISRRCLDVGEMSHSYFTKNFTDVTIDANANSGETMSPNGYSGEISKGILKLQGMYLLHRYAVKRYGLERANKLLNSIVKGNIYFHDASGSGIQEVYCTGMSTTPIMMFGKPYGNLHSTPPTDSDAFIGQCIEFVMEASQQFAGAVALGDLIVNYAYYAKKENLSDHAIIDHFQRMIHIWNNPFRVSNQSPFTNLSIFDKTNLQKVFESTTYPDGSKPKFDYVMHIQKIFCEWFAKGDPISKMPYRFPIITINISCDENKDIIDKEFLEFVSKVNTSTGCFNIYVNSGQKIASCCRLINDTSDLPRLDSFGNGSGNGSIGSHRVVTLNLPRIGLKANGNVSKLIQLLDKHLQEVYDLLIVHREDLLQRRIDAGFLSFYNPIKWINITRYFSTIGIIGVYEMCEFMGANIRTIPGQNLARKVLSYIEEKAREFSKHSGHLFNVEEIPGESVAYKFVQKDRVIFGKSAIPCELYSNQYLPLTEDVLIPERIKISGMFQDILSGGGILHLNIAEKIPDPEIMKKLIKYAVKQGVSHMAVNFGFSKCINGHTTISGNATKCPECNGEIIDHMTRIVGYFVHTKSWSKIRREYEFPRRKFVNVNSSSGELTSDINVTDQ